MKKQRLMSIAAIFALLTFTGHSMGIVFSPRPDELPAFATFELMKRTTVNFPMGFTRNITTLMTGSNLCLSVYLLVAGIFCIIFARNTVWSSRDKQLILINSGGLFLTATISVFCFFPIPAAFLFLASAFSAAAVFSKS